MVVAKSVNVYFSPSLKDYLEKTDSTCESVVWEFLIDLTLVSIQNAI